MTFARFKELFRQTLTDPRGAGLEVIALQLPVQALWMALMLTSVLLSLMVSALFHSAPLPGDEMGELIRMSPAYRAPLVFAIINWVQAVVSVFVLHWIGRGLGGQGEMPDMLAVLIWLQVVSLAMAVVLFVVGLVLPLLGGLAMIVAFLWGIWATVALIDAANRFDNMGKALGTCVLAVLAVSIGMTILSALLAGLGLRGA
ncbi:MAG: YIP1 family protein [Roseovarius sp.]